MGTPPNSTPPATPPTPLPTSAHMAEASSYTNKASITIEQIPHPSSSSTEAPDTSEASTSPQTSQIFESSNSSSSSAQTYRTSSQSSPSSENIINPKNIIKSVRSLAAPACSSSLTLENQKQQQPSLAAINAAAYSEQPSEQTPHALSSLSPSENIIKPKNNIKPFRGLAAPACLSSLTLKSQKQQPSLVVVDAPSQPSANTPLVASSSSKNISKLVRRLTAAVNPAIHPGNQPFEHTPQSSANTPQAFAHIPQPSTNTPQFSSPSSSSPAIALPPFSKNNSKSARGPAASASLSSLPPKKQNQPQPSSLIIVTAESQASSDSASPPLTTRLNESQGKGDGSNRWEGSNSGARQARTQWPFNYKFRWTIFSTQVESEEIIPSPEMGSRNSPPLMSPCIIHENVPRTTLGMNGDAGRGKGVLKFLF